MEGGAALLAGLYHSKGGTEMVIDPTDVIEVVQFDDCCDIGCDCCPDCPPDCC
jgi:hypothetical protein